MTPFCFDHVFRAASPAAVLAAYYDPEQQRVHDQRVGIVSRTLLGQEESETERRQTFRIVPRRQPPVLVRPFVGGSMHCIETARWRKLDDAIDFEVRPSVLGGRAVVTGCYRLAQVGPGGVRRRYEGVATVEVAVMSARIERSIVAEIEQGLVIAVACTQEWLDRDVAVPTDLEVRALSHRA